MKAYKENPKHKHEDPKRVENMVQTIEKISTCCKKQEKEIPKALALFKSDEDYANVPVMMNRDNMKVLKMKKE